MAMTSEQVRQWMADKKQAEASNFVGPPEPTRRQQRQARFERESAEIGADPTPPLVRDVLGAASVIGQQPRDFAAGVVEEALSPSVGLGMAGALAGEKIGTAGGPGGKMIGLGVGAGLGTATGSLIESHFENKGAAEAVEDALQLGASAAVTDILTAKTARLAGAGYRTAKSRLLRGADVAAAPTGGLFGRLQQSTHELLDFAKEMRNDLAHDLQVAGVNLGDVSVEDLDRFQAAPLRPAQLTHGEFLDQIESWVDGSAMGNPFRRLKEKHEAILRAYAESWKRSIGALVDDPRQLSKLVKAELDKVYNRKTGVRSSRVSAIHQSVESAVGTRSIDIGDMIPDLEDDLAQWARTAAEHPDVEGAGKVMGSMKALLNRAKSLAAGDQDVAPVSFTDIKRLRTGFRDLGNTFAPTSADAKARAGKVVQRLTKRMGDELRDFDVARGVDPDKAPAFGAGESYYQKWTAGRKATRHLENEKTRLRLDKLTELIDEGKEGAKAIQVIIPDSISSTNLRLLRDRVGGPKSETWKRLQRWKAEDILNRHITRKKTDFAGLLDDLELIRGARGKRGLGDLFGDEQARKLTQFARLGERMLAKNPTGSKVAVNISEARAIFALITLGGAGGGAAGVVTTGVAAGSFLVGMRLLAKWMMNPKTADLVLTGMRPGWDKTKRGIEAVAALGARAMAEAGLEDVPVDEAAGGDGIVFVPNKPMSRLDYRRMFRAGVQ